MAQIIQGGFNKGMCRYRETTKPDAVHGRRMLNTRQPSVTLTA